MKGGQLGLWGASAGLGNLLPSSRLVMGGSLMVGLLLGTPSSSLRVIWMIGSILFWLWLVRCPIRLALGIAAWSAIVGSPLFAIAALVNRSAIGLNFDSVTAGVFQSLGILLKSCAVTIAGLTTLSTLDPVQLQAGMSRLCVPAVVSGLIIQILVQAGHLVEEIGNVARAIRLRVPARGYRTAWLITRGMLTVWLPRVLSRADRVASAMTLRGFDGRVRFEDPCPMGRGDWFALAGALLWLGASVVMAGVIS